MMTVPMWSNLLCVMAAINVAAWSLSTVASTDARAACRPRRFPRGACSCSCRSLRVRMRLSLSVSRYDVPRICLFDSVLSSAIVGRTVATVAELCFVGQWALLLRESSRATQRRGRSRIARAGAAHRGRGDLLLVFRPHDLEYRPRRRRVAVGLCAAMLVASVAVILPRSAPARRPVLAAWCLAAWRMSRSCSRWMCRFTGRAGSLTRSAGVIT